MPNFKPDWISPPGVTITRILEEKDWSLKTFADKIDKSCEFVSRLILGDEVIDKKLAKRLARHLGSTERFWLKRDATYQKGKKRLAKIADNKKVRQMLVSICKNIQNENRPADRGVYSIDFPDFTINEIKKWWETQPEKKEFDMFRTECKELHDKVFGERPVATESTIDFLNRTLRIDVEPRWEDQDHGTDEIEELRTMFKKRLYKDEK